MKKNQRTRLRLIGLLLAMGMLLSACNLLPEPQGQRAERTERSIWAMDTQMDLTLYGDREGACMEKLAALLNELDRNLSVTADSGALHALNESGSSTDPWILAMAREAQTVSAQTGGALDLTLYPVSRLWGFTTGSYQIPDPAELEALRGSLGMDKLKITGEELSLSQGAVLDLGALAKGYAADLCRAEMEQAGCAGVLSLGGNIQTVGTKPDGSAWVIGVQDPDVPERYLLTLELSGAKAVVTSGDYQRYFMENGTRYCHIIDPKTLAPVRGSLRAVTVVADSGLLADALSTALYVLGRETGAELWRNLGGFEAIWLESDGSIWLTPGLKELTQGAAFEVLEP